MRIKKVIVLSLFVVPMFVLICLVAYRKHHPAAISYNQTDWSATAAQVTKTVTDWNSIAPERYIDASDEPNLKLKLSELLKRYNLSEQQIQESENSSLGLIESLNTGNYNQFIEARIPSQEFKCSDRIIQGLHRFSGLAASASPIEHYQKIWQDTFRTNSLWSQVLFDQTNSIILRTNTSFQQDLLQFPAFSGLKGNVYVTSYPTVAFNYDSLQQEELSTNDKKILIWSLFFMAKEPKLNEARPFMISFFWSNKIKKWIPIEFEHGFIENPIVKYRFF
jgi:hypothetical protein